MTNFTDQVTLRFGALDLIRGEWRRYAQTLDLKDLNADDDGTIFIYYASSDTRQHVATSTIQQLLDYVMNTPADGLTSAASVGIINNIVIKNESAGAKLNGSKSMSHLHT